MTDAEDATRITRVSLTVMVIVVGLLLFIVLTVSLLYEVRSLVNKNVVLNEKAERTVEILENCLTPGTVKAEPTEPTGHDCFDHIESLRTAAVGRIIDSNKNGIIDSVEILEALESWRQSLDVAR